MCVVLTSSWLEGFYLSGLIWTTEAQKPCAQSRAIKSSMADMQMEHVLGPAKAGQQGGLMPAVQL